MLLSFAGFALCYALAQSASNHALWFALCVFMLLRALTLVWLLRRGTAVLFK
jgi:MATE family multidrug resistance protein